MSDSATLVGLFALWTVVSLYGAYLNYKLKFRQGFYPCDMTEFQTVAATSAVVQGFLIAAHLVGLLIVGAF